MCSSPVDNNDWSRLHEEAFVKYRQIKQKSDEFQLPDKLTFFQNSKWDVEKFQNIKKELNDVKSLLDCLDLKSWHCHTRNMNTAGHVTRRIRDDFSPECLTKAWCKIYECLSSFPVIPKETQSAYRENIDMEVNSVHLCEAPGAFIAATNHFIKTKFPRMKWDWLATTLNPYYEGNDVGSMINDDKLILGTLKNWTFLKDHTGNILNLENIKHLLVLKEKRLPKVHFVTADGSVDCQNNPSEQESTVARLHFCEILLAALLLERGGSLVIKMFTFLECDAINNLYFLSCVFSEITLFKPATSSEGNSELYVICLDYIGRHAVKDELVQLCKFNGEETVNSNTMFARFDIPEVFIERLLEASIFFTNYQMAIIKRNVQFFGCDRTFYQLISPAKYFVADEWVTRYKLNKLPKSKRLCTEKNLTKHHVSSCVVDARDELGSYADRIARKKLNAREQLLSIETELLTYSKIHLFPERIILTLKGEYKIKNVKVGKPYVNILSSRFCFGRLVLLRQQLRDQLCRVDNLNPDIGKLPADGHCFVEELKLKLRRVVRFTVAEDEEWYMKSMCFHETMWDLASRTDIDITREEIQAVINQLTILDTGGSLFLCEFSMITRLHVGLIFSLTSVFEKVKICLNKLHNIRGILLLKFKGLKASPDLEDSLQTVLTKLYDSEEAVLEIIPIDILCENEHFEDIFKYNLYNLVESVYEMIAYGRRALLNDKIR